MAESMWQIATHQISLSKSPAALAAIQSTGYSETACLMFFFAGFAVLAAALFALVARRYPMQNKYRA